jgi:hypothetical protein
MLSGLAGAFHTDAVVQSTSWEGRVIWWRVPSPVLSINVAKIKQLQLTVLITSVSASVNPVLTTSWQSWWNLGKIPFPQNYSAVEDLLSRLELVDQIHYSTLDKEIGQWPTRTKENKKEKANVVGIIYCSSQGWPWWQPKLQNLLKPELITDQAEVESSESWRLHLEIKIT